MTDYRKLQPGDICGRYEIEEPIGQGGYGSVYRAVHQVSGQEVALKVLDMRYAGM